MTPKKKPLAGFAIPCWNLSLLLKRAQQEESEKMLRAFSKGNAEAYDDVVKMLLQTKSEFFPTFKKYCGL
jgi:hypothetical protein